MKAASPVKIPNEYSTISSPIGELLLVTDGSALTGIYFIGRKHVPATSKSWTHNPKHPVLQQAAAQLKKYFLGKQNKFTIPLRAAGTEFQEKIWQEIAKIPFGETITYTELAKRAGVSHAIRAAGTSTGRNPISIIIPCHRIVGKNGSLTGFAGGLDKKRHLLELENADFKPLIS
ncbi:MAG TPA: methylated-DNA--[protein]-cysteine S-methyltransferase [Verrucomicrobiae bacterium]|nr:methylated-DNA--[protein]-cysteine S-methyltransferase [Verrucomicrobiae bacterium]